MVEIGENEVRLHDGVTEVVFFSRVADKNLIVLEGFEILIERTHFQDIFGGERFFGRNDQTPIIGFGNSDESLLEVELGAFLSFDVIEGIACPCVSDELGNVAIPSRCVPKVAVAAACKCRRQGGMEHGLVSHLGVCFFYFLKNGIGLIVFAEQAAHHFDPFGSAEGVRLFVIHEENYGNSELFVSGKVGFAEAVGKNDVGV